MTLLDQPRSAAGAGTRVDNGRSGRPREQARPREEERVNVGENERAVSLAAGSIVALLGISRRSVPGLLIAGVGGALIYRGATGHCPIYEALELDTAEPEQGQTGRGGQGQITNRGMRVETAFLINRSSEELYRFWRNFENLPRIMTHLESVRVIDDRRSHWVARAGRLPGGRIEWDAEVTRDDPNELIAWQSLSGSDIETAGQVRFAPALGDRGTEVHVFMEYVPPAGKLGEWIATLFGAHPYRLIHEDLRNFKRLMEMGEVPTVNGQPNGTCMGRGKRYTE